MLSGIISILAGILLFYTYSSRVYKEKVLVFSAMGALLFIPMIVYTLKYSRRIGYVYEYLLFYHDLIVDEEMNQAALFYSAPVHITTIKFDHPKYCERTERGLYRLCEEPLVIPPAESNTLITLFKSNCNRGFYTSRNCANAIIPNKSVISLNECSSQCLICFENPPDCFFLPCGNAGICSSCGTILLKNSSTCHLCRAVIC